MRRKILVIASLISLACLGVFAVHAQGPSSIVGQLFATNYLAPTSGQMAGVGGVVTNPSSNFIIQVSSGTVFCYQGGALEVPQVQMTLQANTTFLIVFNCATQTVYAKTGVTGPGSSGTSTAGSPPNPTSLLYATAPLEIPIYTVVCGSTNCGNTGNGTLTDARVPGQWAIGTPTGAHLITSSGSRNDVAGTCTLGTNCAITFNIPYQVTPACVASDTTGANAVKAVTSGGPPVTTVTFTGTGTDVLAYVCVGVPN
jgi:hypothetical protein